MLLLLLLFFGSMVYTRATVYNRHNFFKVTVYVIIIDPWNSTKRFYKIQVTVIYSRGNAIVQCTAGYL